MEIVSKVFEVVAAVINNFTTALASAVGSVTQIFYDAESGFSFVGVLLLIAVGVGIVYWAFRLIYNLVRRA